LLVIADYGFEFAWPSAAYKWISSSPRWLAMDVTVVTADRDFEALPNLRLEIWHV
jgi:hypothetical protein